MPRRSTTDEPRPDDAAEKPEVEQDEPGAEEVTPAQEEDVTPLVEGAPVSAAARQAARYGTT